MTDLAHHYKEISPEQTIQNIKDYFTGLGFTIKETNCERSEAGTWYTHVTLYKYGWKILGTNGKGINKLYSQASGYAELYERYANKACFWGNHAWVNKLMQYNYDNYGYYFDKNEKRLTFSEALNTSHNIKEFIKDFVGTREYDQKEVVDFFTNKNYIGVPFKRINNETDVEYLDPRLVYAANRSNGMAAGNTLTEALNQGCSEIYERIVNYSFYADFVEHNQIEYQALKLDALDLSEELRDCLNEISNLGYAFYVYDMSYTYNLPVLMSVLIDRKCGALNFNFGAFPVFDIALERIITELYQGISSYKDRQKTYTPIPSKSIPRNELYKRYGNAISGEIFPEYMFDNIHYIDHYNDKIFLDKNCDNEQLLKYIVELSDRNNLKLYYYDTSTTDNVSAVTIVCENVPKKGQGNPIIIMDNTSRNKLVQALSLCHLLEQDITDNIGDLELLSEFCELIQQPFYDGTFAGLLGMHNLYSLTQGLGSEWFNLTFLINMGRISESDTDLFYETPFYIPVKKWITILTYKQSGNYSNEEILSICNNMYDFNVTMKDLLHATDYRYIINELLYNVHRSKEFIDVHNTLIKSFDKNKK